MQTDESLSSYSIDEDEDEENEIDLLRKTVSIMNKIVMSNAAQFSHMATRIEGLEATITSLKRKYEGKDDNEKNEEEPLEERPHIKQKIIIGDRIICKGCDCLLSIDLFDKTSTRRKDINNVVKIYEYRRQYCKGCTKERRQPAVKKKKIEIKTI